MPEPGQRRDEGRHREGLAAGRAADQHAGQGRRAVAEPATPGSARLGQFHRRDAVQGGDHLQDVRAGDRIVLHGDDQVEAVRARQRVLDVDGQGAAAAGAPDGRGQRHRAAAAGDQEIRPGRRRPIARRVEQAEGIGGQRDRQPVPGEPQADDQLARTRRQPLGQAAGLAAESGLAGGHEPRGQRGHVAQIIRMPHIGQPIAKGIRLTIWD